MPTQRFDGPTLEAALEQAKKAASPGARVVAAHKVRSGGVGGWFSKEHVEVEVETEESAEKQTGGSRSPGNHRTASAEGAKANAAARTQFDDEEIADLTASAYQPAPRYEEVTVHEDAQLIVGDAAHDILDLVARVSDDEQEEYSLPRQSATAPTRTKPNANAEANKVAGSATPRSKLFASDKPWAKTSPGGSATGAPKTERPQPARAVTDPVITRGGGSAGVAEQQSGLRPSTETAAFAAVLRKIASEAGAAPTANEPTVLEPTVLEPTVLEPTVLDLSAPGSTPIDLMDNTRHSDDPYVDDDPSITDSEARNDDLLPTPVEDMLAFHTVLGGRGSVLGRLGVPEQLLPTIAPGELGPTWRDLRQILIGAFSSIPEVPELPEAPGSIIAVVGSSRYAERVAKSISVELDLDPDTVVVATSRRLRRPGKPPVTSPDALRERRQAWKWHTGPTVVALEAEMHPDKLRWARKMLMGLDATVAWGVVDGRSKLEDVASWSAGIGGLDALALVDLDHTTSPASALHLGLPIARLEGRPADAYAWADLLTERLTV